MGDILLVVLVERWIHAVHDRRSSVTFEAVRWYIVCVCAISWLSSPEPKEFLSTHEVFPFF